MLSSRLWFALTHTWSHANLAWLSQGRETAFAVEQRLLGAGVAPFFRFPYLSDPKRLIDSVTENSAVGATEVRELYNATVDAHPMHIHEVLFEVVNRRPFSWMRRAARSRSSPGRPPAPNLGEWGYKDTVLASPGQVTRVRAVFKTRGQYVWHCHIAAFSLPKDKAAEAIARAKTLPELLRLQTEFVQNQLSAAGTQGKELVELSTKQVQNSFEQLGSAVTSSFDHINSK